MKTSNQEICYYNDYSEDFVTTVDQGRKLKKGYKWIRKNPFYLIASYFIYYIALIYALIYVKGVLKAKIVSAPKDASKSKKAPQKASHKAVGNAKKALKHEKCVVVYSNHTLTIGDVLMPFLYCFPRRPYIICNPANLSIRGIGRFLPLGGAMPIPDNIHDLARFNQAVETRIKKGHPVIIYPEAHLWPYCTFLRPFEKSAFRFPVMTNAMVYTSTTTYQTPKSPKRPRITVYLDGPVKTEEASKKSRIEDLKNQVQSQMVAHQKEYNTCEFIKYIKKSD